MVDDPRTLDRQLAKAMGYSVQRIDAHCPDGDHYVLLCPDGKQIEDATQHHSEAEVWADCPPFTANTPEGWGNLPRILDEMKERGWYPTLYGPRTPSEKWLVYFFLVRDPFISGQGIADSGPEAIVRAALAALEPTP